METPITEKFLEEFVKFLLNWNKENPKNQISIPSKVMWEIEDSLRHETSTGLLPNIPKGEMWIKETLILLPELRLFLGVTYEDNF